MNDRFNSSGSFTVAIPTPVASSQPITPASSTPISSPELAHPFAVESGPQSKKASGNVKSDSKSAPVKDFEGNRFGVSPLALGLMLGIGLMLFGITQCKKEDFPQFGSSQGEIREYKRYIQRTDLPGR